MPVEPCAVHFLTLQVVLTSRPRLHMSGSISEYSRSPTAEISSSISGWITKALTYGTNGGGMIGGDAADEVLLSSTGTGSMRGVRTGW